MHLYVSVERKLKQNCVGLFSYVLIARTPNVSEEVFTSWLYRNKTDSIVSSR